MSGIESGELKPISIASDKPFKCGLLSRVFYRIKYQFLPDTPNPPLSSRTSQAKTDTQKSNTLFLNSPCTNQGPG